MVRVLLLITGFFSFSQGFLSRIMPFEGGAGEINLRGSVPDPDPPGSEIIWPQGSGAGSSPFSHQT